ncbi:uncharacterized protein F5147DRAFT_654648 [Suillus discolor]|uniref:DUF6532 domain-containing protein n=1 Tax=Suillus discolor TaxID=1912936 RepID=A0A9P7JSA8_9AGAM|nr:uncharacterized protein F5147DRAFT_654648 [Suillus discolor]KAG2103741.1 hypothetical protein F5147DRAFT_654648 [Suillus discolor]
MGKQTRRKCQIHDSDEDVQAPPCHTQRAGTGGVLSQLRKVGNTIETPARVPNMKARNVVVPPDEPENAMAPTKKKGRAKAPRENTIVETSNPAITGLPALHVVNNGRFRLQDQPIPLGYVSSKPLLQSHQTLPEPDSMTPVVQAGINARTRGVARGVSRGAVRGDVAHSAGAPHRDGAPCCDGAPRCNDAPRCDGATHGADRGVSHSNHQSDIAHVPLSGHTISHSPQVSNQRPKSFIVAPPALPDIASSASHLFADSDDASDGVDREIDEDRIGDEDRMGDWDDEDGSMGLDKQDIGIEEEDIDVEQDIGIESNDNNYMDYANYRDEYITHASDHNHQANSGHRQARHSATPHHPGQAGEKANWNRNVDKDRCQQGTTKSARSNALTISKRAHTDSEDDDINTGRKRRNAKKKGDAANPTTLSFFPHLWGNFLNYAKANFRLYLAISVPFPTKEDAISGVCCEAITEAIVYWQDQKRQVEKGYYPKYKREMAIVTQVYNNAVTFRSWIKQVALAVVPIRYGLALVQGNTIANVKTKASDLLKRTKFLHSDCDDEGCASNFAHNALRIVCHKAFYDSRSKSLRQFPTFQKTIPPKALILVATIVTGAVSKQTAIPDSEASYESISTLYERVNKDSYHGPKLHQMLQSWAAEGLNTCGAVFGDEGGCNTSDWDVDLN